jgi:hypothetical protein
VARRVLSAALVALACDDLVMRPGAVLGGEGAAVIDERRAEPLVVAWRGGVAKLRDRPWSLPLATVVPGLVVTRGEQQGTGRIEYFSATELAERKDRDEWRLGAELGPGPLRLDGRRAQELGLAGHVADDFAGLRQVYGLEGDVALSEPGWADELLDALAPDVAISVEAPSARHAHLPAAERARLAFEATQTLLGTRSGARG